MKLPQSFRPEKNLEKNIQRLLTKEKNVPRENISKESSILFEDLEIEPKIDGLYYTFFMSLKRLKEAGYDRHLRPWESFSIITEYFEKRLQPDLESFTKGLLNCQGEWFSMALERKGDVLFCFADPENIKQNRNGWRYFFDGTPKYNYALSKELSVKYIPSGIWTPLDQFNDEFVKYFYNRKLKDLPIEFQGGHYGAQVYIPPEEILWPASRSNNTNMLYIYSCCAYASSRGARRRKNEDT